MADEGFVNRLRNGGLNRVLFGYDLFVAIALTGFSYWYLGEDLSKYDTSAFISGSTSLAGSLTAVIITGVAILVTLTDEDFLALLKSEDVYNNLLFTFEYTAFLSIFVAVFGILLQSYSQETTTLYAFGFFFVYLLFAVSRLISQIISFGDRKGDVAIVNKLDSALGEEPDDDS